MDQDYQRRQQSAKQEAYHAERIFKRQCLIAGVSPDDVDAALAQIAEAECLSAQTGR